MIGVKSRKRWGAGKSRLAVDRRLYFSYIFRLRPLLALSDLELHQVTLLESFVTFSLNGGIVNEYVRPVVLANKAITLGVVKPFYFSGSA